MEIIRTQDGYAVVENGMTLTVLATATAAFNWVENEKEIRQFWRDYYASREKAGPYGGLRT